MSDVDNLVRLISQVSRKVYEALGPGHEEVVYQNALALEFRRRKLRYQIEKNVEVVYLGERVGVHRLDFVVEDQVIVELKAQPKITESHISQAKAYLRNLGLGRAVIVNFPTQAVLGLQVEVLTQQVPPAPMQMARSWPSN